MITRAKSPHSPKENAIQRRTSRGHLPQAFKLAGSLTLALCLAGCLETTKPPEQPLYQRLNQGQVSVNPQAALNLINDYRANKGLAPLSLEPRLMAAAQEQANGMADAGKVRHSLKQTQTLPKRLKRIGYDYQTAVENVSAGYWTLAEAFSGWRDSKNHNKNMLNPKVTHMGIATRYKPNAKYGVFWAMVLAKPSAPPMPLPREKSDKTSLSIGSLTIPVR
ncbi:MAG: CAP domain-containing protein [Cohaesibacter sp.]|nr:CAP domain-containing protein [Cohaesibacter sp.]